MNTQLIIVCKQCGKNPTQRKGRFKAVVPCDECQKQNKINRNLRLQLKRKESNRDSHRGSDGKRYGLSDRAIIQEVTCFYCHAEFIRSTRRTKKDVCPNCKDRQKEESRIRKLNKAKDNYKNNPEQALRRRLKATLEHMGLNIEWYDALPKECAICSTKDSGSKNWCIDHDHRCCPYGPRQGCSKCVRGLLCSKCNAGLGCFKDDPDNLKAAIQYLSRHQLKS